MAFRRPGKGNTSFMRKIFSLTTFFLILLLFTFPMAFAEVQVRIRAIEASNVGSSIDPSLRDVQSELKSLPNFTSYRLLKDESLRLSPNQTVNVSMPKGISLEITLIGQQMDMAESRVKIKQERTEILNTQVRLFPEKTVFIGKGAIIIAISARF